MSVPFKEEYQMNRNRVWLLVVALCLAIALPAGAWEFKLKATATYEYEMIGQTGRNGFFGPYDVDASAGPHNFSSNFWPGLQPPGQVFGPAAVGVTSSSDARWMTQYAEFFPEFNINPAVSLKGSYYIGAWQDLPSPCTTPLLPSAQPVWPMSMTASWW